MAIQHQEMKAGEKIKIFTYKVRKGVIERVQDERYAIVKDLFNKETNLASVSTYQLIHSF